MTIGETRRLIYPIFWGRANDPVPNDKIHKLKIQPRIEPGPIGPQVLWGHVRVSTSSCSSYEIGYDLLFVFKEIFSFIFDVDEVNSSVVKLSACFIFLNFLYMNWF